MKNKQCLWLLLLAVSYTLSAQESIQTHTEFSAQTLVTDIFASGACENIDLISSIGHEDGLGYFENGQTSIGIESGIILSTGNTQNAHGPNDATDKSTNLPGPDIDVDLSSLASGAVHDAVGIEFDFVPLDSVVQFRYVFASEEYCEFVGSNFNDVFGFFISGPGINGPYTNGAVNVALVPGTNDYVSINTINYNSNPTYYVHNELGEDQEQCGLPTINHPYRHQIQYDGFTQVMTARLRLQACQSYHIRLLVGDVSDPFFDSAVFLEAKSFSLGPEISVEAIGGNEASGQLYEGCEDAVFRFTRTTDAPVDLPFTVRFQTSDASTATEGLDYEPLPNQITIPSGAISVNLPVSSLQDDLAEEAEFIRLVLDIPCACYADSADLFIVAPPPLELRVEDTYLCPDEQGILTAVVDGGAPPFEYFWSTGETMAQTVVPPDENISHTIEVKDKCGQLTRDTVQVILQPPPTAMLSGSQQVCAGDTAYFPLELSGVPPFELQLLHNGDPYSISLPDQVNVLGLVAGGYHELVGVSDAACAGQAQGGAQLERWEIIATADVEAPSCFGAEDGAISVHISQGIPPYQLNWLQTTSTEDRLDSLGAGKYELQVTDNNDCQARFSWEVYAPVAIDLPLPDCDQLQTEALQLGATGGVAPYTYQLNDNGLWLTAEYWWEGLTPGEEATVTVRDDNGCEQDFIWLMPRTYPNGLAWLPEQVKMTIGTTEVLEWERYVPESLLAELRWGPLSQISCSDCHYPEITAISSDEITLYIEDIFGCNQFLTSKLVVSNSVDIFIPNAFSPNGDEQNDKWIVFGNEAQIARISELLIFDRWGNMVFRANDWPINSERHGWDGRFRGQLLTPGVYAYALEIQLVNGERQMLGGDILLLR